MANEYTKKQIIEEFTIGKPYQRSCVNYNGETDNQPYIEIIAEHILNSKKNYNVQPYFCDRKSFEFPKRNPKITEGTEKHLCRIWSDKRSFFDAELTKELGIPFECELNLVENTHVNVDLVSYFANGPESSLYLIEVKGTKKEETDDETRDYYYTKETLLRCALEIETYWESLMPKFDLMITDLAKKIDLSNVTAKNVKKAILIPSGTHAEEQFLNKEKYKNIHALLEKWDIKVIVFDKNIIIPK